jgi:thymidylate synthase ThyX
MYKAEVLLDSINPLGTRLTTMRVTMPRFILAEFNTHRKFSRNAGSSRAIPISRRITMVRENPFVPESVGQNQKGMQAGSPLADQVSAMVEWRTAATEAANRAEKLQACGVHKQWANRILEPFCWVEVIVSSTEWDNFFIQRISPLAQPEMQRVAREMKQALDNSVPTPLGWGQWHCPTAKEREVAVGRLARVSYESDPKSDAEEMALGERLAKDHHWSPFEHIAQARMSGPDASSRNYDAGWVQWRAMIDG